MSKTDLSKSSLVTIAQASKTLGVHKDTLRRWEKAGKIQVTRDQNNTRLYHIPHLMELIPSAPTSQPVAKPASNLLSTAELLKGATSAILKESSTEGSSTTMEDSSLIVRNDKDKFSFSPKLVIGSGIAGVIAISLIGFMGFSPFKQVEPISSSAVESNVLAATTSNPLLKINADMKINKSLSVNGDIVIGEGINGLVMKTTTSDSSFTLTSGNTQLTVTNTATLDQDVSTTSSPSFSSLALSSTSNQLSSSGINFTLPSTTTTLVGKDTTDTLTNKSLSGSSNTFTNIPNSALSNNKVTVSAGTNLSGGGDVSLGSSVTLSLADSPAISGVLKLANGTASAPSLAFSNDTNTGLYYNAADSLGIVAGGTNIFNVSSTGILPSATTTYDLGSSSLRWNTVYANTFNTASTITVGDQILMMDGTAAAPALSFTNDTDSGLWRIGANNLALTTAGSITSGLTINSSGNVGIGTSSQNSKLAVAGSVGIGASYSSISAPGNGLIVEGRVGVGTSNPTSVLDVLGKGTFEVGNNLEALQITDTAQNKKLAFKYDSTGAWLDVFSSEPTNLASNGAFENNLTGWTVPIPDTYTTQPDDTNGQDTYFVSSQGNDYGRGSYTFFITGNGRRALIKFPLDPIPGDATVTSATVSLYNNDTYAADHSGSVYRILPANSAWLESVSAWNYLNVLTTTAWAGSAGASTADVDYSSTVMGSYTLTANSPTGTEVSVSLDLTEFNSMLSNNAGIILPGDGTQVQYQTSEGSTSSYHPKLAVAYTTPGNASDSDFVTRDTTTTYNGSVASAKIVASTQTNMTQSLNVGDTSTYTLVGYVYTDGNAVTSSDVSLYYNGATITTAYDNVGGGWYKITGTVTGANESRGYGIQVESGKTVYLDNFSVQSGSGSNKTLYLANTGTGLAQLSVEALTTINTGLATGKGLIVKGFTSQTANLTEWQNINGSALAAIDASGNLGIGTSTPTSALNVIGNVGIGTSAAGSQLSVNGNSVIGWGTASVVGPANGLGVYGNVGIGTTTANYNLSVVGTTNITGATTLGSTLSLADGSAATPGLNFSGDADSGLWRIGTNQIAVTTGGAAMNGLSINSSGNVGIGTTNATSTLDIISPTAADTTLTLKPYQTGVGYDGLLTIQRGTNTTSRAYVQFATAEGNYWNVGMLNTSTANDNLSFSSVGDMSATAQMTLTTGGNLGIGYNTAPNAKLAVNGNVGIGTSAAGAALQVNGGGLFGWGTASTALSSGAIAGFNGNVGIGTTSPDALLHVQGSGSMPSLLVTSGGNIGIGTSVTSNPLTVGIDGDTGNGAFLSAGGTWTDGSSREFKENFTSLDPSLVLGKINSLSITQWNYKLEGEGVKHIGPIAEEFYSTFGVGNDNKHISPLDTSGIALLGIQALSEKIANLSFDTDGTLIVPKLKTSSIILDPALASASVILAGPRDQNLTSTDSGVVTTAPPQNDNTYNLSTKLTSFEDRIKQLESVVLSATSSASVIPSAPEESSTSSGKIATSSATEVGTPRDDITLKLTTPDILLASGSAVLTDLTVKSEATVSGLLTAYDLNIQNSLKSLGKTSLGNTTIAGSLVVDGTMSITRNSINSIGSSILCHPEQSEGSSTTMEDSSQSLQNDSGCGVLYLQDSSFAQGLDILNGTFTFSKDGTLTVSGTVLASQIVTNKLTISNTPIASSSAVLAASIGSAVIPAGQTEVPVFTSAVTNSSKVFLTATSPTSGQALIVSEIIDKTGFVVSLDHIFSQDIKFNWWVVDTQ